MDLARLWLHEASRVYGDKLIDTKDIDNFLKLKFEVAKASFDVRKLWHGIGGCIRALFSETAM